MASILYRDTGILVCVARHKINSYLDGYVMEHKRHEAGPYSGQFDITPDLLHVTIPQHEIVAQMLKRGEQDALNDVCLAVAVVADAIASAQALCVD